MAEGVWLRSKVCFPRIVVTAEERAEQLRTDARFRSRFQPRHHQEYSILEKLPIDMIRTFPTSDSLHLLDLGIMKRLLLMWIGEFKSCPRTWTNAKIIEISNLLLNCNHTKPTDIHRSVRPLKVIKHWKATEFRTILLYVGIVIFKDFLTKEEYELFVNLFCIATICSTKTYKLFIPKAKELIVEFIEMHIDMYDEHSITSNIHLLSHMTDDVEFLGDLSTISAYPFENKLQEIKSRLKQCNRPLQQIARRIHELSMSNLNVSWNLSENFPKLSHPLFSPSDPNNIIFQKIELKKKSILSSVNQNKKDRWFLTKQNHIVQFDSVIKTNNIYMIRGNSLKNKQNFFDKPFASQYLNIFSSDGEKNESSLYELNNIKAKLFSIPYKDRFVFMPLLHTM